jgi:hypothetical protein
MKSGFNLLVEEILKGGLADNKTLKDIAEHHGVDIKEIQGQFNKGKKVEMEHTTDPERAGEIARDHLWENPKYYDRLEQVEEKCWDGYERDYSKPEYSENSCKKKKIIKKKRSVNEASKCTGPTKKASSDRKGKKWMQCVKSDSGGYKRIHWGQAGVRVKNKNNKLKKSFKKRHKCSMAKPNTPNYFSCKDWN